MLSDNADLPIDVVPALSGSPAAEVAVPPHPAFKGTTMDAYERTAGNPKSTHIPAPVRPGVHARLPFKHMSLITFKRKARPTLPHVAQAMQGDKGIDIKDRRWHLRLHYDCSRGEEFTSWLLHTFKEGEFRNRDERVDYGNTLMEGGLFIHVNGRHNFRDNNNCYSIAPDYRNHPASERTSKQPFFMELYTVSKVKDEELRPHEESYKSTTENDRTIQRASKRRTRARTLGKTNVKPSQPEVDAVE